MIIDLAAIEPTRNHIDREDIGGGYDKDKDDVDDDDNDKNYLPPRKKRTTKSEEGQKSKAGKEKTRNKRES